MSHKFVTEICVHCGQVKGNNDQYCPAITLDEPYSFFTSELQEENKKLNDFSQGLVAINLSLTDQVSQLRYELEQSKLFNMDHFSNLTSVIRSREVLRAKNEKLEADSKAHFANLSKAVSLRIDTSILNEKLEAENKNLKANEQNSLRFQRELNAKCVKTEEIVDSLRAEIKELRKNQINISDRQRSSAWGEVHKTLNEVAPGWHTGNDSGMNLACATIRKLAEDAKKFRSLTLITGHTVIGDQRYIRMRKVGRYFYQEYKPS